MVSPASDWQPLVMLPCVREMAMIFEFATKDGIRPKDEDVPTRVSVGGREYDVRDFCIDAPAKFEKDLALHGFRVRIRPGVVVNESAQAKSK